MLMFDCTYEKEWFYISRCPYLIQLVGSLLAQSFLPLSLAQLAGLHTALGGPFCLVESPLSQCGLASCSCMAVGTGAF